MLRIIAHGNAELLEPGQMTRPGFSLDRMLCYGFHGVAFMENEFVHAEL